MNMSMKKRARRAIGIVPLLAAMSLSAVTVFAGEAGAATGGGQVSDVVTFTSHVTLVGGSRFGLTLGSLSRVEGRALMSADFGWCRHFCWRIP